MKNYNFWVCLVNPNQGGALHVEEVSQTLASTRQAVAQGFSPGWCLYCIGSEDECRRAAREFQQKRDAVGAEVA